MLVSVAVVFFALLVLGVPIGFTIGFAGLAGLFLMGSGVELFSMVPLQYFSGLDMFTLMAMPFFIFAGEIMNKAGITHRLVRFANILAGNVRGGLAHANIIASVFFAGMTGAAVSDTAAIGTMLIPAMEEDGYDLDFSAAVTAASSIIGPTIPPSNMMVIYGSLMNVSIAGLFAAGFMPGIVLAGVLMILTSYLSIKRGYPKGVKTTFKEKLLGFKDAIIPLLMPIIILGGILSGTFTPTEAAAVAVLYAVVIGFFVLKSLKPADLVPMLTKTARITGVVFLIIGLGLHPQLVPGHQPGTPGHSGLPAGDHRQSQAHTPSDPGPHADRGHVHGHSGGPDHPWPHPAPHRRRHRHGSDPLRYRDGAVTEHSPHDPAGGRLPLRGLFHLQAQAYRS
jgi:TRAP-type transport system large permease protein